MKKLLIIVAAILGITGYVYFYFSAPRVLERRLDSLLDSMSFGLVTLKDMEKEGDHFASHFAPEVTFSGSGNEIVSGTVTPAELKEIYLLRFRVASKSANAATKGDVTAKLTSPDRAEMKAFVQVNIILRDNTSYPQNMPVELMWQKINGKWVISEVQLLKPTDGGYDE